MKALPLLLLVAGCTGQEPQPDPLQTCEGPRPQVCTMVYAPVCVLRDGQAPATYASACNACADDSVDTYLHGACAQEQ